MTLESVESESSSAVLNFLLKTADPAAWLYASCAHDLPQTQPSPQALSLDLLSARSLGESGRENGALFSATELNIVCAYAETGEVWGSKLVSFAKRFSKHSHIFPIFKVDSEYLRLPFKLKVDYFILYSILVSTFAILLLLFFYEQKKTHERSVPAINSIKHPHIFSIFKVWFRIFKAPIQTDSGRLFYTLLNSRFHLRNFSSVFFYEQKKILGRSRKQFFHSNVYIFKRKQK